MRKVTCLQIPIVVWINGRITGQLLNVPGVNVWQSEIHTADPLVPKYNSSLFEMTIGKVNICKSPDTITFQQKCFHQEVEQYILRSINLLLLG
jgi:hypothetical protein